MVYDNYPVCSWVVKGGEIGVLIPPFEIDTMAKEVISLAKNQNRQDKLMQAALANARKFDIDNVGKLWVDFFNSQIEN